MSQIVLYILYSTLKLPLYIDAVSNLSIDVIKNQQDDILSLRWRHNELDGVSNHQPHDCLLNRLFRRRSQKTSKLRVTGLCAGISPATGEIPAQRASNAENVSIWWRHHVNMESLLWYFKMIWSPSFKLAYTWNPSGSNWHLLLWEMGVVP